MREARGARRTDTLIFEKNERSMRHTASFAAVYSRTTLSSHSGFMNVMLGYARRADGYSDGSREMNAPSAATI